MSVYCSIIITGPVTLPEIPTCSMSTVTFSIFHCYALQCSSLHFTALYCTARHYCTALHCTALHCTALNYTTLQYNALNCTALHCTGEAYLRQCNYCFVPLGAGSRRNSYQEISTKLNIT